MREVLTAHDNVLVSFVEALLREAHVDFVVLDRHLATTQLLAGSVPQRVMVHPAQWQRARDILRDAGLAEHLADEDP
jgi:hypothetical protein